MSRFTRDDIDKMYDYGIYLPTRTLYMGSVFGDDDEESGVDFAMAEMAVKGLHILDAQNTDRPITVLMNNIGGDEYHGFAIYDAIKECQSRVTVKVYGHAMSMGSIILQAADWRVMTPTSRMMLHYGTWGAYGHAKTTQKWAEEGRKIDDWMEQMYLARIREKQPEFTLKKLKAMLDHDTFLTAQEAVDLGLADEVSQ